MCRKPEGSQNPQNNEAVEQDVPGMFRRSRTSWEDRLKPELREDWSKNSQVRLQEGRWVEG